MGDRVTQVRMIYVKIYNWRKKGFTANLNWKKCKTSKKNSVILPLKGGILLGFLIDHLENTENHPLLIGCDLPLPRKGGILLWFLIDHLENPEQHPLVMGCDTLTLSDRDNQPFDCTTFVWEVLTVYGNKLILFNGQGIPLKITIYVVHLI